jgi:putative phage-type endonuclease
MTGRRLGQAVHIGTWPPGTPEWHAARAETVNGSEIAAILGISPYDSPFSLWHRKAGRLGEVAQDDVMYWGSQIEPVIRDEFNRRHPGEFGRRGFQARGLFRHHDRTWQGGGPDGVAAGCLLEVKTARYDDEWGEPGSAEIPVHYRAQCLWYLDVFGYQVCHVAALITGSDYREYRIEHDADEAAFMRDRARAFLDTLTTGQAPPIDGHTATYEAVKELHPEIEAGEVELPAAVAEPYLAALAAVTDAETEKRRAAAEVLTAMGGAQYATYRRERIASRIPPKTEGRAPYLRAVNGAADRHRKDAA